MVPSDSRHSHASKENQVVGRAPLSAIAFIISELFCARGSDRHVQRSVRFSLANVSNLQSWDPSPTRNSDLYITGTVNLLFLQQNCNRPYTPASTRIDSISRSVNC